MNLYQCFLILHITSGFIALISGVFAMLADKKKPIHSISGRYYYYSMWGVFLTIIPMFMIKGQSLLFLLLIGVFSQYLVITGRRYLQLNGRRRKLEWYDYFTLFVVSIMSLGMITLGIFYIIQGNINIALLLFVFGSIMVSGVVEDIKAAYRISFGVNPKTKGLAMHIKRMGGAYIATFTAFIVNNSSEMVPFYISWFLPGIIGGLLITMTLRKRRRVN